MAKLIIKVSLYPSKEDSRGATEAYLAENHPEFYKQFKETRWTTLYNNNIQHHVSFLLIVYF